MPALACCLAVVCLVLIVLRLDLHRVSPASSVVSKHRSQQDIPAESLEPTLLTYQRALAHSPEDLQALMNKQSVTSSERNTVMMRVGMFTQSEASFRRLLGDD
jgi:hypothetical protein